MPGPGSLSLSSSAHQTRGRVSIDVERAAGAPRPARGRGQSPPARSLSAAARAPTMAAWAALGDLWHAVTVGVTGDHQLEGRPLNLKQICKGRFLEAVVIIFLSESRFTSHGHGELEVRPGPPSPSRSARRWSHGHRRCCQLTPQSSSRAAHMQLKGGDYHDVAGRGKVHVPGAAPPARPRRLICRRSGPGPATETRRLPRVPDPHHHC